MDAIELLRADHQKIRNLFDQIRSAEGVEQKLEIFERVRDELDLHSQVEETVFYPTFEKYEGLKAFIEQSYEEHQDIVDLTDEIAETDDQEELEDDLEELMEDVEFHLEKEENELFPKVRGVLDSIQLRELGNKMLDLKERSRAA